MPRGEWKSVPLPTQMIDTVDGIVEKNKYPIGKYHSRSHYIIEAVKEKLEREEAKKLASNPK